MGRIIKYIVLICAMMTCLCACGASDGDKAASRAFPIVEIPSMLDAEDKIDYVLGHMWDAFLDKSGQISCDTTLVNGVKEEEVTQVMANYAMLLGQVDLEKAYGYMSSLTESIISLHPCDSLSHTFTAMRKCVENYLYDANSPLRDEDIYHAYCSRMASFEGLGEAYRQLYSYQAEMCAMNRRGTVAADFAFSDKDGRHYTLHGISADLTILFFSNPGCTACKQIIEYLSYNPEISSLVQEGKIAVVNVYIDEDLKEWYDYIDQYPEGWYNGYDHNHIIRDDELYNVRAIPSLYLLDKDKKVILKDVNEQRLFVTLDNMLE